jgi:hypothetical protein
MNMPPRPTDQDNEFVFEVEDFEPPAWLGFVLLGGAAFWLGVILALLVWAL